MAIRYRILGGVLVSAAMLLVLAGVPASSRAASGAQAVITWRALESYVPPAYGGKALPNQASQVTASVEAFADSKRSDLSDVTVYWYLNDTLIGGGLGARSMSFTPFGGTSGPETLRVEMPDYPSGLLMGTVQIPVVSPTAVIGAPYPAGDFSVNPLVVDALPYFWNITSPAQLSFGWSVNGQPISGAENPDHLQVTLGQGTRAGSNFDVQLAITNAADSTTATDEKVMTYQPLPQ
jgi:hypothetical protein